MGPQRPAALMTILARDRHYHAACFDEINTAIEALLKASASLKPRSAGTLVGVCFNAHAVGVHEIPPNAIIFNMENVGIQIPPTMFEGHEIWDFSARNVVSWLAAGRKAIHVPIGFHPSMIRFQPRPWHGRDIDVVFSGSSNARRDTLIHKLRSRGLHVVMANGYAQERDQMLARAKVAINVLFYEDAVFPVLRSAHLIANRIITISEKAPEVPDWISPVPYEGIADRVESIVRHASAREAEEMSHRAFEAFTQHPLEIPAS